MISVDLDGTLSEEKVGSYPHETIINFPVMKKEILKFKPKKGIDILNKMGIQPIIITGRHEVFRDETEQWLKEHGIEYSKLVMVTDKYYEPKHFSWEKYQQYKLDEHKKNNIKVSFDDDSSVVSLLNKNGIPAYKITDDFEKDFIKGMMDYYNI